MAIDQPFVIAYDDAQCVECSGVLIGVYQTFRLAAIPTFRIDTRYNRVDSSHATHQKDCSHRHREQPLAVHHRLSLLLFVLVVIVATLTIALTVALATFATGAVVVVGVVATSAMIASFAIALVVSVFLLLVRFVWLG